MLTLKLTIQKDLGVDQNVINAGSQLLSAGIVLFEIPANVLFKWLALLHGYMAK